jgi:hypothetical protein
MLFIIRMLMPTKLSIHALPAHSISLFLLLASTLEVFYLVICGRWLLHRYPSLADLSLHMLLLIPSLISFQPLLIPGKQ